MYYYHMPVTFKSAGFSPEQCKALSVVESILPVNQKKVQNVIPTLDEICTTGSLFIIEGKISTAKIPRGNKWLWNQSRARKETKDITGTMKLLFFKLNTRKSRAAPHAPYPPPLKVWVFIVNCSKDKTYSVLWCERGFKEQISTIKPQKEILLEDLLFLRPYVSESAACTFGWSEHCDTESLRFEEFLNTAFTTWDHDLLLNI